MSTLYIAFKGKGNSSNRIVSSLSGDKLFLTNSYDGIKRDIDNIDDTCAYDAVYMFGLDKKLKGRVRIDCSAVKDGMRVYSDIDINVIIKKLDISGIDAYIGNTPTHSLCNAAYWHMLKKYNRKVVFFHVPSIRYITEDFIEKIKTAL